MHTTNLCDETGQELSWERLSGLRPQVWLSVGTGYAREDIKSLLLAQGRGFVAEAVITLQELCLKILDLPGDRVLTGSSRQELLRLFLAEKRIMADLVELKKMKRQKNFIAHLDLAIQGGRLAFAHSQEEEVYSERLEQVSGIKPLKKEIRAFAKAYEAWLEAAGFWDLPLLLRQALLCLRERGWPAALSKPQEIWICSMQTPESLEREFWEVLEHWIPVRRISTLEATSQRLTPRVEWQRWHTLDDAAEFLADQLVSAVTPSDFDQHAVLIPDIPSIRRSLKRALEMRGIPLAEPRDPTQLQWDESLKQALLPLQVVARQFDRQKVIAWLRTSPVRDPGQVSAWVEEMNSRGIRSGLSSYAGGVLQDLYLELCELLKVLGGRKTAPEVGEKHLEILRGLDKKDVTRQKMASFFEGSWATFAQDLERTGQEKRRASLLYWLERIESRLGEASPPVDPLKPQFGVRLYRLQQAPVLPATQVWLFGIPPRWLRGEGTGDLWFSERDREILASEFAIRSWVQVREERLKILHFWMARSEQWTLLDAEFDAEGRERESLFPFLREFGLSLGLNLPESPKVQGAHFRTARSYGSVRPLQPVYVGLPPTTPSATGHPPELSATLLDRASRCSFQGLAFHRWKLKDVREPKTELWPDVRGNILHEAVRIILQSLSSEGQFGVLPKEALLQAWKAKGPKGLIQTPRVVNYAFSRMERILEVFCEKERDYLKKSQVIPLSLDEMTLRLHYPTFSIRGQPDRIDQSQQGIFIIDYKSSGGIPHGTDMIEQAYRLQLPFYAIAAARQLNQDVLGVQFVELDKKGGRKSGILFKEFNGKEPGKLTQLRANSKSLISIPREEVWAHLEAALIRTAEAYLRGEFEAVPRTVPAYKECTACRLQDLCGFKRRTDSV